MVKKQTIEDGHHRTIPGVVLPWNPLTATTWSDTDLLFNDCGLLSGKKKKIHGMGGWGKFKPFSFPD